MPVPTAKDCLVRSEHSQTRMAEIVIVELHWISTQAISDRELKYSKSSSQAAEIIQSTKEHCVKQIMQGLYGDIHRFALETWKNERSKIADPSLADTIDRIMKPLLEKLENVIQGNGF